MSKAFFKQGLYRSEVKKISSEQGDGGPGFGDVYDFDPRIDNGCKLELKVEGGSRSLTAMISIHPDGLKASISDLAGEECCNVVLSKEASVAELGAKIETELDMSRVAFVSDEGSPIQNADLLQTFCRLTVIQRPTFTLLQRFLYYYNPDDGVAYNYYVSSRCEDRDGKPIPWEDAQERGLPTAFKGHVEDGQFVFEQQSNPKLNEKMIVVGDNGELSVSGLLDQGHKGSRLKGVVFTLKFEESC